ncbi:MAG: PorT family protein, partial [Acidobacteriota bacterium]|nr:PorT family protein [Acidobacteriota bacterium]
MRKLAIISFLSVVAASAQSFSLGVIGGAPFTNVINNNMDIYQQVKSSNFTVGPSLQLNLPLSLRLEVDALYRPYEFTYSKFSTDVSARQFRFPVLLQYRFSAPFVKPFVEGGLSFDHLADLSATAKTIGSGSGRLLNQSNASVVLGAGVDVK